MPHSYTPCTAQWTLSLYGFRFPLLMGITHMLFSFLALGPIMLLKPFRELHAATLNKQWMGLLAISTLFAMNVSRAGRHG